MIKQLSACALSLFILLISVSCSVSSTSSSLSSEVTQPATIEMNASTAPDDSFQDTEATYFPAADKHYKTTGNVRFDFCFDLPQAFKAVDRSANGDGYEIDTDSKDIDLRAAGCNRLFPEEEYYGYLMEGKGKITDFTFRDGSKGKMITLPETSLLYYIRPEKDRYIMLYLDYSRDKAWYEKNRNIISCMAKSLRMGKD